MMILNTAADTSAEAGMVTNHAVMISAATFHRTAESRCPEPAPMMLEETTCVVETGPPIRAADKMTAAELVCAQKAWTERSRKIFAPMVLMILHPPVAVPAAIAPAQLAMTQKGIVKEGRAPMTTSDMVMIPMDFCASLAPWLSARQTDETICMRLKKNVARGVARIFSARNHVIRKNSQPKARPTMGEITRITKMKRTPRQMIISSPCAMTTAPISPPTKAWEELEGRPSHHVRRFQAIAPSNAATMSPAERSRLSEEKLEGSTMPVPIVLATAVPNRNGPMNSQMVAIVKARTGESAPVTMIVATTLAAS